MLIAMNIRTIREVTIGRTIDDKYILNFAMPFYGARETTIVANSLEEAFQQAGSVLGLVDGEKASEWSDKNIVTIVERGGPVESDNGSVS